MNCELHATGHVDDRGRYEYICHRCKRTIWWYRPPKRNCAISDSGHSDFVLATGREHDRPLMIPVRHPSPWRALYIKYHARPNVCGLQKNAAGQVRYAEERCIYLEFEHCAGCSCANPPAVAGLRFCPLGKW